VIATHVSTPPYALTTPTFPFRALAALAGRAALGGEREVALATYLVARLAHDCLPDNELSPSTRIARSTAARAWLSSVTLPAGVRAPLARLTEATEGERATVAVAVTGVIAATTAYLDGPARSELERLARALAA